MKRMTDNNRYFKHCCCCFFAVAFAFASAFAAAQILAKDSILSGCRAKVFQRV